MARGFLKFDSLRSRLMLLVALAIAPSVLMTIYTGWKEREHAIEAARENLQRLTNLAAVNEAESIRSARQLLMDLSDNPDLIGGPQRCDALLKTTLNKNPSYANLGLIQMNGDVSCSAVASSTPVNLADRAHFKRAIFERRFIAGNYVFGRVIQKHTINLTYPIFDANAEVIAVVFAALDLSELDKFVDGINLSPGSILVTADSGGSIISRRPDPQDWFGKKVTDEMFDAMSQADRPPTLLKGPDGVTRLHAFARIGTPEISDFSVTIGIPSADIVAAATRDQITALLTLAATTLLALIATWFLGEVTIVRRVRALVGTADKIALGKLDARTGIQYGREEISLLARAVDGMAEALQKKDAERNSAEEGLRAADRRKDEFLAMLAHELRNPLAPISSAAQILKLVNSADPRVRQTGDIIGRQVEHMTGLIDDLLDVSRVTRGLITLSKEQLDLRTVVDNAIEQVRSLLETRRHRLIVEMPSEPVCVYGDRMRLIQIVSNLLNNAAKYTPEDGEISLWVKVSGDACSLGIKDNGMGISSSLMPHVFELFSQADRTPDRSQGGLGLGLSLVKSLVELHGGTITAHSDGPGQGSEFIFGLPRLIGSQAPLRGQVETAQSLATSQKPLSVMVVDDNEDAANMVTALLRSLGYAVAVEYSGSEALKSVAAEAPQVFLLDIGMPDMDGYELAGRLKQMPHTAGATLIALTGYGQEEDRRRSKAAGFDHHLVKPADMQELAVLLHQISLEVEA